MWSFRSTESAATPSGTGSVFRCHLADLRSWRIRGTKQGEVFRTSCIVVCSSAFTFERTPLRSGPMFFVAGACLLQELPVMTRYGSCAHRDIFIFVSHLDSLCQARWLSNIPRQ